MNVLELFIFILFLFLLIFIDGVSRIAYILMKSKPDFFMYSFFRYSIIVLLILLFIRIFPNFYYYSLGFLVYLLFSGLFWRYVLSRWYSNYTRKRIS